MQPTDRKSSVYNQTGEGYFEQLTAYNNMSAHLRRVLLAKSRINSRNPSYSQRQGSRSKSSSREKALNKGIMSQDLLDRLAYDTEHHPFDILRMGCGFESRCEKYHRSSNVTTAYCSSWYTQCPGSRRKSTTTQLDTERSRSMSRRRRRRIENSTSPNFNLTLTERFKKDISNRKNAGAISFNSSARSSPRSAVDKKIDDETALNYAESFESLSETSNPSPIDSTTSTHHHSNNNDFIEEAKYSKFLYNITQEIVQNGYYTDEELKRVFEKHIKLNSPQLDKNKMLYELYQLKLSLNMLEHDNDEEEEQIQQFIESQKLLAISPIKPPTPPKVLDENKLMDKLMNPDKLRETYSKSPHSGRNTVVLVDANPELLISERDILATLMEMNIHPKQAQKVYKRLQKKSKDFTLTPPLRKNGRSGLHTEEQWRSPQSSNELISYFDETERISPSQSSAGLDGDFKVPTKSSERLRKAEVSNINEISNKTVIMNNTPSRHYRDKKNTKNEKNEMKPKIVGQVLQKIVEVIDLNGRETDHSTKTTKVASSLSADREMKKISPSPRRKSRTRQVESCVIKVAESKSSKVMNEIQRNSSDKIDESIAESLTDVSESSVKDLTSVPRRRRRSDSSDEVDDSEKTIYTIPSSNTESDEVDDDIDDVNEFNES